MDQEIKVGDWIEFQVGGGLTSKAEVSGVEGDVYYLRGEGATFVHKDDVLRKVAMPDEERGSSG